MGCVWLNGVVLANLSGGWLILGFVVMPISLDFFFNFLIFIFKVALVDVGLCRWWLVGVVPVGGQWWMCRCCC